jgi:coatomer subunit beta'
VLELWKADLKQINEKAADALADPAKYPNLFPDLDWAIKVIVIDRPQTATI